MLWPSYKQLAGLLDGAADGSDGKESARNAGDLGSIPGSGSSSGEGNGYPLQYSCLENPMDRGAWQAISPWGRKEMDMTKQLTPPHTHTYTRFLGSILFLGKSAMAGGPFPLRLK